MIEFNVGNGKVLATTLRILPTLADRLESRYLLKCLLDYVIGPAFAPNTDIPAQGFVQSFITPPG